LPQVFVGERGVERGERVKRMMMELGVADRALQQQLPVGERLVATLRQRNFWMMTRPVGRIVALCVGPTKALIQGETPTPMNAERVNETLAADRLASDRGIPTTVVLMSTSGFTADAAEMARTNPQYSLILAEPNDSGGWTIHASAAERALADALDPEQQEEKRDRVRSYLAEHDFEVVSGGLAAERIAASTQLPVQIVEVELKSYAREHPGLAARKIDGRMMLYREGSAVTPDGGGTNMPFWERIRGIFKREESTERKIARLSGERASLAAQRERCYDEIASVEKRESELTKSFKDATALAQRRIATEIAQLRKDIERRQQILGAIDKKVNVINTGIHTLELKQQLDPEKLKSLENIAVDSEEVEAGMAALQQLDEEANEAVGIGSSDVPEDVQSILDELRGKTAGPAVSTPVVTSQTVVTPEKTQPAPVAPEKRRNEPEAG
jgi:division protein CdvB (Snf7/Vps24/ESCRT-III family)